LPNFFSDILTGDTIASHHYYDTATNHFLVLTNE